MQQLSVAGVYIAQTVIGIYMIAVLLRFLLQLVRADFYNPVSQFVVKATSPVLNPLRRIIPGFGGVDIASLVLVVILIPKPLQLQLRMMPPLDILLVHTVYLTRTQLLLLLRLQVVVTIPSMLVGRLTSPLVRLI